MKIKNIAFSGFAAAIFATLGGTVDAASVNLASKGYVDDKLASKANLIDLQDLETTVGQKATIESLEKVASQVNVNTTDIAELKGAGYQTSDDVKSALDQLEATLNAAIAEKQDKGNFAQAAELNALKTTVEALQAGAADKTEFESLQASVNAIALDYAKKTELTAVEQNLTLAIQNVQAMIPSKVSAFENDAGYITSAALTPYAKSDDVASVYATKGALTDYATVQSMNDLQDSVDANAAAIATNAADISDNATAIAENAGDIVALGTRIDSVQTIADSASIMADANATDIALLQKDVDSVSNMVDVNAADIISIQGAGYQTSSDVQGAITTAVAPLATTAAVNSAFAGVNEALALKANTAEMNAVLDELRAAIEGKQQAGEYAAAADLKKAQDAIVALQSGKADATTVVALQESVQKITTDYATDADLQDLQAKVDAIEIPSLNGYVQESQLGKMAYKDSVATDDIDLAAVTPAKIQGAVPAEGETMFMSVNGAGDAQWVSVKIYN